MFVKTQPLECVGCGNCIAWWAFLLSPCHTKCLTLPRRPHHNFAVPNHPRSTAQVVQQVLLQVWRVWAVSPWGLKNLCTEKTDGRCFLETLRFFLPKKNLLLHFFGWKNVKTFTKKKNGLFFWVLVAGDFGFSSTSSVYHGSMMDLLYPRYIWTRLRRSLGSFYHIIR